MSKPSPDRTELINPGPGWEFEGFHVMDLVIQMPNAVHQILEQLIKEVR